MKTCSKCSVEKSLLEFYRNRDGQAGLHSQCKACRRAYCKAWHDQNRERSRAVSRKYHKENREAVNARQRRWYYSTGRPSVLVKAAKCRARQLRLPCTLTKEWVAERLAAGICEVTGIPFQDRPENGAGPYSPSIDRIVPEFGYTRDNCRLVLFALNVAMRDWGLEVVKEIAQCLAEKSDG